MDIIELVEQDIAQIDQNLIQSNIRLPLDPRLNYRECKLVAELIVKVEGKPSVITVGFPESYPGKLPLFFDRSNQFGRIPHKESDGFICFTRNESMIIDTRHPGSLLLNCLIKVIDLVEKGIKRENLDEFASEFEAYWARQSKLLTIYAHIDIDHRQVRPLELRKVVENGNELLVAAEQGILIHHVAAQLFKVDMAEGTKHRCFYLPMEPGTFFMPPPLNESWDYETIRLNLTNNLSIKNRKRFFRLFRDRNPLISDGDYVIVGYPIPNGRWALFGFQFSYPTSQSTRNRRSRIISSIQLHPLAQKPRDLDIRPTQIKRWHPNHLLSRTGGTPSLLDKHVVIVGTGSIGSNIAMSLAKAGIKQLTLIDEDWMQLDNIHRHALGYDQVFEKYKTGLTGKFKVIGLKEEIHRKYPFTSVNIYLDQFEVVYEKNNVDWSSVDLVIVAIGSPNVEMEINQLFHDRIESPPVIYSWVEPLGIGGHVLITLNGVKEGCYQCLFSPSEDDPIFNRSAFAQPFQSFSKSITGCGSTFTPYNFLDSEKTANLTLEATIKTLTKQEFDNPLLSWKGDPTFFLQMNYKTTPRFSFSVEKLSETRLLYKDANCPVCRSGG
ncbi:ThiF family adenylyltransferase [Brevibacillus sp. NPDC003359]|uniref:ThiF family adenylyltransferase n=1 Tax=unclassified Brevibacillus TaxID=2684853 RepID=UPI0036A0308C